MSNLSPDFTLPINFCANPQDAWTIPARFYTDSQAFEHEKERIFANSWICVAHGSEVARPNDYITREIIGENIVIVRGRDNILRAFYNVCPHRGHQLLSGEGKAKNVITCPYHAWAFKLDGNLAHARNCENVANFDSEKATLVPVRLEEYAGFVFINMNPQAESVETQLPGLQDKVLERQLFFRKLPHLLFADAEGFQMLFHNRMLHPNRILLTIAVQCPADDLLRRQLVCRPLVIDHRPDITLYADIREGQVSSAAAVQTGIR